MSQKTFYHYMGGKRPITVKIDNEFIVFHYTEEDDREFYHILVKEWVSDKHTTRQGREDNWHFHMKEKSWFNQDIEEFINSNT